MSYFSELAASRRSIRKYATDDIDIDEIIECLKVAVTAPSGCNSQCWKFVVIHDKDKIRELANIARKKEEELIRELRMECDQVYLDARMRSLTFFERAPVCVAVFMTKLDYYDKKMERALLDNGYTYDGLMELFGYPDLLSIGAAIQNFLLALSEKGLGACWMNDPVIAKDEIAQFLGMTEGERLISLIPVGKPAYTPRSKVYKDIDEVVTIIQ
jgi:nitroreductase